ncbi:BTAD domain-containing putative transcriptional regulator [Actinomadura sp. 9N407]|uniref:BTAD domain-containing putative transcriptional regulator n=1 Tax=Actinomadura sp. 9N407 TaxID=3375154 RepID=UPI0037A37E12
MTRLTEIGRGIGALTLLALLLIAFPVILYGVGGSPLPGHVPTWPQITSALMRPDADHTLFLGTVRLIGWTAWALFATLTGAETLGYLAGRPSPRMPRPARPMQHLARDLVAMTALIFTTSTAITTPVTPTPAHAVTAQADPAQPAKCATILAVETSSPDRDNPAAEAARRAPERRRWRTRTIERGDTLWDIARRHYGSGTRYPKIFEASRKLLQPPGLPRLTDPDRIYPGQRIRLPGLRKNTSRTPTPASRAPRPNDADAPSNGSAQVTPTPPTTSPPQPAEPSTASAPAPSRPVAPATSAPPHAPGATPESPDNAVSTISLVTGTHIGIGLAAALSTALAATRLHRRRRRPLNDKIWPGPGDPEPATPAAVARAHKAHLDSHAERGALVPTNADLIVHDQAAPAPDHITVGTRDGAPVALPLPGLELGLDGPGALDAARAIATELLAKATRDRVELLIPQPDVQELYPSIDHSGPAATLPGLTTVSTLGAAITHLEAEIIHRARLLETTETPDLASLLATDPGEPLPTLLVLATTPEPATNALHAVLQLGRRYGIGGLFCGPRPTGTTAHITDNGTVTSADGPHANALNGARLFHLSPDDATDMLHTLHTATGQPEPAPAEPAAETAPAARLVPPPRSTDQAQPALVELQLLGPVQLHTADGPINTGLRRSSRSLLTYLALHPNGVSRDQGTAALWPDHDPDTATTMFHTAISNTRKILRQATGLREPMFIIHAASHYRLDPHLTDSDLWRLTTTLEHARQATNDTERTQALQPLPSLYTADFATDQIHEWAEAHREYLRRTVVDALAHLAQLTQDDHPDQALATLEHALRHDPYSEHLHRNIMKLQAHLGRPDAVRRTYQLLTTRLAELDTEPDDQTHQLMTQLCRT